MILQALEAACRSHRPGPRGLPFDHLEGRLKPLAIDLFCGLGGWTGGLLEEGWDVIGFDIEARRYGSERYPAQLVLQDVLTIHGSQFKSADLIVASPPCQEYSYMAMPWSRAKEKARKLENDPEDRKRLTALFDATFRIQAEASAAAGRHIPLVVENVRGAQRWVGRARTHYGSFYLWGDVPALMPIVTKAAKVPGFRFDGRGGSFQTASVDSVKMGPSPGKVWSERPANVAAHRERTTKNNGGSWFAIGSPGQKETGKNPVQALVEGFKGSDGYERAHPQAFGWKNPKTGPGSNARKAASAQIAKIPERLARYIAAYYYPIEQERTA